MPTAPGIHVIRTTPTLTEQQQKDLPAALPGSGLGQCSKCQGDLCVSNQQVVCDRCGMPHKHSITDGREEAKSPRLDANISIEQNAGSFIDRLVKLERINDAGKLADLLDHQADLIRNLTRRVAKLEGLEVNGIQLEPSPGAADAGDVDPTPLEIPPPADQTSAEKRLSDKPPNHRRKA